MTSEAVLDGSSYRGAVRGALGEGWEAAGLHASSDRLGPLVRALLVGPSGETRLVSTRVEGGAVPTLVDIAAALGWDEREAHDLHDVTFDGHEPLRPLVRHDPVLRHWTVPVSGTDAHQVAVGPIHAGVIESGHFRFHVVGDRVLLLDGRLFYKHRGLEAAAVGASLDDGLTVAARACGACWVTNAVAYAHACEAIRGLHPSPELARARTVLLELERLWSHFNDIGAMCAGVGMAAGAHRFAAFTEDARRLNASVAGHRFAFGSVQVGGSALSLDAAEISTLRAGLDRVRADGTVAWRELLFNASFMDRMPEIGVVTAEDAASLGTVGPAARAAGRAVDVRATSPRLAYEGFEPALLRRLAGDVQARLEQRALELVQCLDLLDALLDGPIRPSVAVPSAPPEAIGIGRVESPRGATTCIVEPDGDRVARLRLRTGSYANWPSVAHAVNDALLPDFPLINKSFELCYACADR
jgi:Ni,Fe-hydrogenase III large subunit